MARLENKIKSFY